MIKNDIRDVLRHGIAGALIGLPVLGVGGRSLMRVIAHREGRVPVLTVGGTINVLLAATMAGLAAGITYGMLRRFVASALIRHTAFLVLCVLLTWRAVNELLPWSRLMFVALTIFYAIILELWFARRSSRQAGDTPALLAPNV